MRSLKIYEPEKKSVSGWGFITSYKQSEQRLNSREEITSTLIKLVQDTFSNTKLNRAIALPKGN